MWPPESRAGSPDRPDLLQHVQAQCSPATPLYLSFFEEECRAIAASLRLGAAAESSPGLGELSVLLPEPAGPATSTPLPVPSHGRGRASSEGDCEAAAAPAPRKPGCRPQPAAGGGFGARSPRPPPQSRRARRGPEQPSGGGPGSPARSLGRGRTRLALPRTRASLGLQLPAAGTGRGAWETRLLRPPATRLKLTSPARSRLQYASGASQQAQPSSLPKPAPRDREMKTAVKAGSRKQPSSRLSTAIPVASRSSLRLPGKVVSSKCFCLNKGSTTQELVCNRTQELKENGESKEKQIAARIVLGAGKPDQTWLCVESSLSRELAPGLTSWHEDAGPAEQSAGDQLSQELEHVKKELERVKDELADKTAQCEAYQQTIFSLQAQLRAAGIYVKDAAVFDRGDLGRD
ncbi:translation initiation factor IF-2-like [Parus major]|uniref:translation initiation factor IF-2-like n=1 Tax=Parus major TaxID=9157 RepID=UPI0007712418|nr:translation initiation factor IF-2-like [Parus major]